MATERHWTSRGIDDFVHRIATDFVFQLEQRIDDDELAKKELAERLGVTGGAVSQTLNNPGNLGLRTMVQYAGALGMKVAVLAYDDSDHDNNKGPILADVFTTCWQRLGKPQDFFDIQDMKPGVGCWILYKDMADTRRNKVVSSPLNVQSTAETRGKSA